MLKNDPTNLDYFKLIKAEKKLDPKATTRTIRVAVLGDCATQQVCALLRVLLRRQGIGAEIYEAGFDTIETEIIDPDSSLYAFRPDAIVIVNTTNALKPRFYQGAKERETFAASTLERITSLWSALRRHTQALIVQSNFVLPYERVFGNYDHQVGTSLVETVKEINRGLTERSRTLKNVAINDLDYVASWVGRRHWFDEKLWILAKSPCALERMSFGKNASTKI